MSQDTYAALSGELVRNETLELQADGENTRDIVNCLPLGSVSSVLDVGCGAGSLTRAIAARLGPDARICGIDIADEHIRHASRMAAGTPQLQYEHCDVFGDLSRHARRYDLVIEKYVLMSIFPFDRGQEFIQRMRRCARPGGTVVLIEADINFGQDRHPVPPPPLATVLPAIVDFYYREQLIDWRCGTRIYGRMKAAALGDVNIRLADARTIAGGEPRALVEHANTDVEPLIEPCLRWLNLDVSAGFVAEQWRSYFNNPDSFVYNPVFVCAGVA
jgi:ubiquinone/menaquinone biosynthesis C-methylase UbiE